LYFNEKYSPCSLFGDPESLNLPKETLSKKSSKGKFFSTRGKI